MSICTPTGTARRAGHRGAARRSARDHREAGRDHGGQDRRDHRRPARGRHRWSPSSPSTGSTRSTEIAVEAIARGELGRLTSGIAAIDWWRGQNYYDSGDWRGTWELDGGGALMNQGVHTVDLLVATLGRPVEVFAYTGTLAHERIEVEDVAVGVVRFESGALGVLHATTAAYPGLSARLQVHGDKGSVVIDNDELTFIHLTPRGSEGEEKAYGSLGAAANQIADYVPEATARRRRGQRPGRAVRRRPSAPVRELPGRAGRRGDAAGRPGDQPAGDRDHHRRVRVRPHRSPGEPGVTAPADRGQPDPLLEPGRRRSRRRSSTRRSPTSPAIGFTAVKADVPDGHDRRRTTSTGSAAYGLAPSVSLFSSAVRRDGRHLRRGRAGQGVRGRPAGAGAGPDHGVLARGCDGPPPDGRRSARTSARTGWPWRSRTAASSARCCSPRVCARCTTPTSAGSSRPRRRSPPCSTSSART